MNLGERRKAYEAARASPDARDLFWEWRDAGGELPFTLVYDIPAKLPSEAAMWAMRRPVPNGAR